LERIERKMEPFCTVGGVVNGIGAKENSIKVSQ
jgi:hypothetical protein